MVDSPRFEPDRSQKDLSAEMKAAVEAALSRRTRDLWLTGDLLALWQERSWPQRSKIIRAWFFSAIVIDLIVLGAFAWAVPAGAAIGVVGHSILVLCLYFATAMMWRKPRGAFVEGLVSVVAVLASLVAIAILGVFAGGIHVERLATAAVFIASTAVIIFGIDFRWTLVLAACSVLIMFVTLVFFSSVPLIAAVALTLFYAAGAYGLIQARRGATVLAQRSFLLSLRNEINVRDLAEANDRLSALASIDPLTGIANRRFITQRLAELDAAESGDREKIAFVMVDIDHFKGLNDTLGHAEGDACIIRVAQTIAHTLRPGSDIVARYGGEEFLVVMTDVTAPAAAAIAEDIRAGVERLAIPNPGNPTSGLVTVSVGIAVAAPYTASQQSIKSADDALFQAKRDGRNRIVMDISVLTERMQPDARAKCERTGIA